MWRMTMGLSLAISSEQSEIPNSARNTHSDQKPRRLARKFLSRRRVSGVNAIGYLAARLEVDPGVDQRIGNVAD